MDNIKYSKLNIFLFIYLNHPISNRKLEKISNTSHMLLEDILTTAAIPLR